MIRSWSGRAWAFAIAGAAALFAIRVYGVSTSFQLNGDQIGYWGIALNPLRDQPLIGPESTAGGHTLGPAYYWFVWLTRVLIGPFTGNLPHAGGIGTALMQSAADGVLMWAIWRRWRSWLLALSVVWLAAFVADDIGVSSSIWNPPVAEALIKLALAMQVGAEGAYSRRRVVAVAAALWLAVQVHSAAIFAAAPMLLATVVPPAASRLRDTIRSSLVVGGVIVVLQLPMLWFLVTRPGEGVLPTQVLSGVAESSTVSIGALALRARDVLQLFAMAVAEPAAIPGAWLAVAAVIGAAAWCTRRGSVWLLTIAPPLSAVAGFSLWPRAVELYWLLPMVPALALGIGLTLRACPPRVFRTTSLALLIALVVVLPHRLRRAHEHFRIPGYGAIVDGTRAIARERPQVYRIDVSFDVPPMTDPEFVYRIFGGTIDPHARFAATIDPAGHVSYRVANPDAVR